jgi:hypothetical protein
LLSFVAFGQSQTIQKKLRKTLATKRAVSVKGALFFFADSRLFHF